MLDNLACTGINILKLDKMLESLQAHKQIKTGKMPGNLQRRKQIKTQKNAGKFARKQTHKNQKHGQRACKGIDRLKLKNARNLAQA